MIKIIDLDKKGLTAQQVAESVQSGQGGLLRREGEVVARLEPADQADLDDELWARSPEQVHRGEEARGRLRRGEAISHERVCRDHGIEPNTK